MNQVPSSNARRSEQWRYERPQQADAKEDIRIRQIRSQALGIDEMLPEDGDDTTNLKDAEKNGRPADWKRRQQREELDKTQPNGLDTVSFVQLSTIGEREEDKGSHSDNTDENSNHRYQHVQTGGRTQVAASVDTDMAESASTLAAQPGNVEVCKVAGLRTVLSFARSEITIHLHQLSFFSIIIIIIISRGISVGIALPLDVLKLSGQRRIRSTKASGRKGTGVEALMVAGTA
jgi:hypothetical protein